MQDIIALSSGMIKSVARAGAEEHPGHVGQKRGAADAADAPAAAAPYFCPDCPGGPPLLIKVSHSERDPNREYYSCQQVCDMQPCLASCTAFEQLEAPSEAAAAITCRHD